MQLSVGFIHNTHSKTLVETDGHWQTPLESYHAVLWVSYTFQDTGRYSWTLVDTGSRHVLESYHAVVSSSTLGRPVLASHATAWHEIFSLSIRNVIKVLET